MGTKTFPDVKHQMTRIERMILNDNFYPKDPKRYKKWCILADAIDRQMLDYFGVNHLWEAHDRRNVPLPYEVRVVRK